ncbi:hypothetical protein GCM10027074_04470 [Streptomyces deserti]
MRLSRPEGSFVLRPDATNHFFAGDETAAIAFGAMLAALPENARSRAAWRRRWRPTGCRWTTATAWTGWSGAIHRCLLPYDGSLPRPAASPMSQGKHGRCKR